MKTIFSLFNNLTLTSPLSHPHVFKLWNLLFSSPSSRPLSPDSKVGVIVRVTLRNVSGGGAWGKKRGRGQRVKL